MGYHLYMGMYKSGRLKDMCEKKSFKKGVGTFTNAKEILECFDILGEIHRIF
jgi:hypothetical protein